MGFRLLALDLDDTLLNGQLMIPPAVARAIFQAKEKGALITLATGRMFRSTLPFAQELKIDLPLITYQGALIKKIDGQVLWERPLLLEGALELVEWGYSQNLHINLYLDDILYVDRISPEALGYARQSRVEPVAIGNLANFLREKGRGPIKVLFIGPPEVLDVLAPELSQRFQGVFYITKSKPHYLEVLNPRANKGNALAELAHYLGVPREEVVAVGDSDNDLPMLEFAGMGVAMGNAPARVKARADFVAPSNEEEGVARVIELFFLDKGGLNGI